VREICTHGSEGGVAKAIPPPITQLMGYGTVMDGHAGGKGAGGKPRIIHEVDLNTDIHYKLQCYQATRGSGMHGIGLAHKFLSENKLPLIGKMTNDTERFRPDQIREAIDRAGACKRAMMP